ncbi:hypothetical protein F1559_000648 [Cyanidiococcus yangmingshanensis]|uniref:Uncharacterized protein n=1 Tax=Cyanidiococcus yangmingshanensis TaxID=2690220 RepID=A0A7J7IER0_9RHOD|nr:hypothetical protein F1559_000648 [Cyanidiococcus yangmingshanensis]
MRDLTRLGHRRRKNSVESTSLQDPYQAWRAQLLVRLRSSPVDDAESGVRTVPSHQGRVWAGPSPGQQQTWREASTEPSLSARLDRIGSGVSTSALLRSGASRPTAPAARPTRGKRFSWTQSLVAGAIESLADELGQLQQQTSALVATVDSDGLVRSVATGRARACCSWILLRKGLFVLFYLGTIGFLAHLAAMAWGGIAAGTVVFLALTLFAWFIVSALWRKDRDACAIARLTVLVSGYCMWLMWLMCYMDQMNPIIRPVRQI